jgi:hypothetical protein
MANAAMIVEDRIETFEERQCKVNSLDIDIADENGFR